MIKKIFIIILLFQTFAHSAPLDPRFFANRDFQNKYPGAFALQTESQNFVAQSLALTIREANLLIKNIQRTPGLAEAILRFPNLTDSQKIQTMQKIFALQTRASGFQPPKLVLDNEAKKSTFFDFNLKAPGPGEVILNPAQLFQDPNPFAALLFLIHETRHSQQFQLAFKPTRNLLPLSRAYSAAFSAQKEIFDFSLKASYCDFLTLNNEYEAFLFGNYVMEVLTAGKVETGDMGTYASQYIPGHGLKIYLPGLARKVGSENLLDAFNQLELPQYKEVYGGQK